MTPSELTFNRQNVVTESLRRIDGRVHKTLNGVNPPGAPADWRTSLDPEHWNYWRREYEVYQSELGSTVAGAGVRLPKLESATATSALRIELVFEWIEGSTGQHLDLADYERICRSWGAAQGRLAQTSILDDSWTSRHFVRRYAASKSVDYALLESDEAWQQPLIRDNWSAELRAKLLELVRRREALYDILEQGPQIPSHLDFWPNNVLLSDAVVLIDWGFFGAGAIGEDLGNFIPDAVFDGFIPPERLPEMVARLLPAYADGLREGGIRVTLDELERNVRASAVKYVWLAPLLLHRAGAEQQRSYGGEILGDANEQYRSRGAALEFLTECADAALRG